MLSYLKGGVTYKPMQYFSYAGTLYFMLDKLKRTPYRDEIACVVVVVAATVTASCIAQSGVEELSLLYGTDDGRENFGVTFGNRGRRKKREWDAVLYCTARTVQTQSYIHILC